MASVSFLKDVYGDNHEIIYVKSTDKLEAGQIVVATTLSTVSDEGDVYVATTPVANTDGDLAIVVGEEFYEDEYGNRIGITDPTKIDYPAGKPVRAIKPNLGRKFAISDTAITGTAVVGEYLIPTAGTKGWTASATIPASVKFAMLVEFKGSVSFKGNKNIAGVIARTVISNPV